MLQLARVNFDLLTSNKDFVYTNPVTYSLAAYQYKPKKMLQIYPRCI